MSKQVQIDEGLFWSIHDYFFGEDAPDGWQADEIRAELNIMYHSGCVSLMSKERSHSSVTSCFSMNFSISIIIASVSD